MPISPPLSFSITHVQVYVRTVKAVFSSNMLCPTNNARLNKFQLSSEKSETRRMWAPGAFSRFSCTSTVTVYPCEPPPVPSLSATSFFFCTKHIEQGTKLPWNAFLMALTSPPLLLPRLQKINVCVRQSEILEKYLYFAYTVYTYIGMSAIT